MVTQYHTLGLSLSNPSLVEIIIFNVSFRIEIVVPVLMALSQIAWNNMTGTEDQLFEDCLKLPNEPKRVSLLTSSFMTYNCLFVIQFLESMAALVGSGFPVSLLAYITMAIYIRLMKGISIRPVVQGKDVNRDKVISRFFLYPH